MKTTLPAVVHKWFELGEGWAMHPSFTDSPQPLIDIVNSIGCELTPPSSGDRNASQRFFIHPFRDRGETLVGYVEFEASTQADTGRDRLKYVLRAIRFPGTPNQIEMEAVCRELSALQPKGYGIDPSLFITLEIKQRAVERTAESMATAPIARTQVERRSSLRGISILCCALLVAIVVSHSRGLPGDHKTPSTPNFPRTENPGGRKPSAKPSRPNSKESISPVLIEMCEKLAIHPTTDAEQVADDIRSKMFDIFASPAWRSTPEDRSRVFAELGKILFDEPGLVSEEQFKNTLRNERKASQALRRLHSLCSNTRVNNFALVSDGAIRDRLENSVEESATGVENIREILKRSFDVLKEINGFALPAKHEGGVLIRAFAGLRQTWPQPLDQAWRADRSGPLVLISDVEAAAFDKLTTALTLNEVHKLIECKKSECGNLPDLLSGLNKRKVKSITNADMYYLIKSLDVNDHQVLIEAIKSTYSSIAKAMDDMIEKMTDVRK